MNGRPSRPQATSRTPAFGGGAAGRGKSNTTWVASVNSSCTKALLRSPARKKGLTAAPRWKDPGVKKPFLPSQPSGRNFSKKLCGFHLRYSIIILHRGTKSCQPPPDPTALMTADATSPSCMTQTGGHRRWGLSVLPSTVGMTLDPDFQGCGEN